MTFGKGLRRKPSQPKGRQLDEIALDEVRALLGDAPRRRDLLIEHLHRIQDAYGHLSAAHLRALAEELRLSQAEVYEVASFYHHFDIVREGEQAPAPLTVRVCDSVACSLKGADALAAALETGLDPAKVRVQKVPCIGRCAAAPAVQIGKRAVDKASELSVRAALFEGTTAPEIAGYTALEAYRADGGYQTLDIVRSGALDAATIADKALEAGLRGLGGAGFPTGTKWKIVNDLPGPKYLTINGDEGEPGTFKDRYHLERDPHRLLEGALIAAHAIKAERIYLYMRDEYPAVLEILSREIAALRESGIITTIDIELRRGAGAYICGEESAMIESIEGKRGLPRHRPPFIAQVGLFGRPTLNHNVETLFWIRDIIEKGPEWFASHGRRGHKGFRSFSVSGRVKNPGVKFAPAGITMNELLNEFCGGMEDDHAFKGYLPGGASGGILPASLADEPLDFGTLDKHGCFIGSHAIVVFSDHDDMRDVALNLMRFFEHESCGQCTPCRSGTEKMVTLLEEKSWDENKIADLDAVMRSASICGLGQAAANPVASVLKFFPEEFGK
ncbi:NAD-dependent formate dehydrogenase flavoprotein subunit [Roseibium hamelinense]|uniref:NAD-dependent formate dehydrogenase flavoprotein subunit n=1 Tax=Roseibium hamelinense TaxID=150831 RepID=A0A562T0P3_9HYPH|nr:NAD(P)H-dependent oxidoreductase subunit E [Roseibium hamelinense]MTI43793.1 NADH-quinone oxidoreductase subunit F [Roseibium hamelinense]TWI87127.1 NAD-dependent formate dehydrogenase flavoprotein subunit [Roseibium hamelinense]